jgi:hypothetical protein
MLRRRRGILCLYQLCLLSAYSAYFETESRLMADACVRPVTLSIMKACWTSITIRIIPMPAAMA